MNTQPLNAMRDLALRVCEVLRPFCVQIEVAGSIRRGRPQPADIDIVALPEPRAWLDFEAAWKSCADIGGTVTDGTKAKRILLRKSRIQCDLWIADLGIRGEPDLLAPKPDIPGNYGALLLTYTGSKEHNIHVVETARAKGWRWSPSRGLQIPDASGGVEVVSLNEEAIFKRLFNRFIPPAERERGNEE